MTPTDLRSALTMLSDIRRMAPDPALVAVILPVLRQLFPQTGGDDPIAAGVIAMTVAEEYLAQPEPLNRKRLAEAIADHGDICSRMAIPECAPFILARLSETREG